jgi:hypothetical protein
VLEIKAGAPLANGTPLFDSQARLVGIVVAPHTFDGVGVAALGAARITQSRNVAGAAAAAPAQPADFSAAASPVACRPAPEERVVPPPAGARSRHARKMVARVLALWKEDETPPSSKEAHDSGDQGPARVPTRTGRKEGRDGARPTWFTALVTTGPEEMVIAEL